MSDLTDLLPQLPVPDHTPDFWNRLESQLADTTHTADDEPTLIDPATGEALLDDGSVDAVIDLDERRRSRRWALAATAAVAAAILAFVIGFGILSEEGAPGPVVTEPTTIPPPSTTLTSTTTTSPTTTTPGPAPGVVLPDGIVATGLPIELSQYVDLGGDPIQVSGTDFPGGAQIGIIQCSIPIGYDGDPSIDFCDLSNFVLTFADDDGAFSDLFTPRRLFVTATGSHDCIVEPERRCMVAAGLLTSLATNGLIEIRFDPSAAAEVPRVVSPTPMEGLRDGAPITVTGSGFVPGETVIIAHCTMGYDLRDCPDDNGGMKVIADGSGAFGIEIPAMLHVRMGLCPTLDEWGCRIVGISADGGGESHAVQVRFTQEFQTEASPFTNPAFSPFFSSATGNGELVRVDLPLMGATPGERFEARQCERYDYTDTVKIPDADRPPVCGPAVAGTVDADGVMLEIVLQPGVDNGEVSVDCLTFDQPTAGCAVIVETATYRWPAASPGAPVGIP